MLELNKKMSELKMKSKEKIDSKFVIHVDKMVIWLINVQMISIIDITNHNLELLPNLINNLESNKSFLIDKEEDIEIDLDLIVEIDIKISPRKIILEMEEISKEILEEIKITIEVVETIKEDIMIDLKVIILEIVDSMIEINGITMIKEEVDQIPQLIKDMIIIEIMTDKMIILMKIKIKIKNIIKTPKEMKIDFLNLKINNFNHNNNKFHNLIIMNSNKFNSKKKLSLKKKPLKMNLNHQERHGEKFMCMYKILIINSKHLHESYETGQN